MPHCRRFLGVNSVTNIEPDKGVMPVPIIRNAYWFEKISFAGWLRSFCRLASHHRQGQNPEESA